MWPTSKLAADTSPNTLRAHVLAGLIVLLFILSACDDLRPASSQRVVKVGLVAPFAGRYRDVGYDVIYSARLAIREANQQRGPEQTKVALVAIDDFGDPETARVAASAMAIDPDVVAVMGHWLPETTSAAEPIYAAEGLPFLPAGEGLFGATDPANLNPAFLRAYEEVTPFDESAGPFSGTAYDGMQLILVSLAEIEENGDEIDRVTVGEKLKNSSFEGITGTVRKP